MNKAWVVVIILGMGMMLGCTNEVGPAEGENSGLDSGQESGAPPSEVENGVQVDPGDSCIGLQENPANEPFSPMCESLFTSEEFKAENGSCLILDDKPDQPCFCKICGVKGGGDTMKFL